MPTVIDSLIVELGLDPKQFEQGQKEAASAFLKTKNEALKTGSVIEKSGKASAAALRTVTKEALALFAVLIGARGLKEFVTDVTTSNAALGRFAANLAQAPQLMAGWGMAAQRVGGSAEATRQTVSKLAQSLYDLHQNGQMLPKEFYQLQALSGVRIDTEAGLPKFLNDTATALQRLNQVDPQKAHFMAQGMGIDDATANYMMKMGPAANAFAKSLGDTLGPNEKAIKSAQELMDKWVQLQQQASHLGNAIVSDLTPHLTPLLDQLTKWISDNEDWIATEITDDVEQLATNLKQIDWQQVGKDIHTFAEAADGAAHSVGGWVTVAGTLFALWTGAQFAKVLANVGMLAGAIARPGAAGGGLAFKAGEGLGMLGGAAAVGGLAYEADKRNIMADPRGSGKTTAETLLGFLDPKLPKLFNFDSKNDMFGGDGVKVEGQQVSKANPLPVTAVGSNSEVTGRGLGGSTGSGLTPGSGSATTPGSSGSNLTPVGPNAGTPGWWTAARQAHAVDRLMKEGGLSLAGAKGLVSRWANVESRGGPSSSNNIGGGHYGIAQESRSRGADIWGNPDFDAQLSHIIKKDLKSPAQAAAYYKMKAAQTDAEGAIGASMYERAEGYNPQTGLDNFTGRTVSGMRGMDDVLAKGRRTGVTTPNFGVSGASGAATLHQVTNDNRAATTSSSTTSHEVHIGTVQVNAPNATDAKGVASGMKDELDRSFSTATSNYGPR